MFVYKIKVLFISLIVNYFQDELRTFIKLILENKITHFGS
jgi:hypothetical protein